MNLRSKLMSAVRYTAGGHFLTIVLRFGSTLILTRLLAPDMFGLMAMAGTFLTALAMFSDMGLRNLLIQSPRAVEPRYRDIVWTLQILRGLIIGVLGAVIALALVLANGAGLIAPGNTYADPRLPTVIALLMFSEVIRSFESVQIHMLEREFKFRPSFWVMVGMQLVTTVVTIAWAWVSPSVYALCSGPIAGAVFVVWVTHRYLGGQRHRLAWDRRQVVEILSFSKWIFLSSALTFVVFNFDKMYLAAVVSPTELGWYSIALTLAMAAYDLGMRLSNAVGFPALSERFREAPQNLRADLYRMRLPMEAFAVIIGVALAVSGDAIVRLLYDPRYESAGPLLQIMGIIVMTLGFALSAECYMAMAKPKLNAAVSVARLVSIAILMPLLTSRWGIVGGAWALALSYVASVPVMLAINTRIGLMSPLLELRSFGFAVPGLALGFALKAVMP